MSTEQAIPKDTTETLLEHPGMKLMTGADAQKFCEWTGAGTEKFDLSIVTYLLEAMEEKQADLRKGLDRAGALLTARYYFLKGSWPGIKSRKELYGKLLEKVEDLGGITGEGFSEQDGVWTLKTPPETDLAEKVIAVVDELPTAENSKKWGDEKRDQARETYNKLSKQKRGFVDEVVESLAEQGKPVDNLDITQEKVDGFDREALLVINSLTDIYIAASAVYNNEKLKKVKKVKSDNKKIPEDGWRRINNSLEKVLLREGIKVSDQTVKGIRRLLLQGFGKEIVTEGTDQITQLADILRYRLEEKRIDQENARQIGREKRKITDYFLEHEIVLEPLRQDGRPGVENELMEKLEELRSLGMKLPGKETIECETGNDQVNLAEFEFDDQGRPVKARLAVAVFNQLLPIDRKSLIEGLSLNIPLQLQLWKDSGWKMVRDANNNEKIKLTPIEGIDGEASVEIDELELVLQFSAEMSLDQAMMAMTALISALDRQMEGRGFDGFVLRGEEGGPEVPAGPTETEMLLTASASSGPEVLKPIQERQGLGF